MGKKSKTAIAFQAAALGLNCIELLVLVLYFFGVIYSNDTYIYFNLGQYVLGLIFGFFVFVDYYDQPNGTIRDFCQLLPFGSHVLYHTIGHIVSADIIIQYRSGVIMFMIGKSISSINVFITYLHQDY